jgi:hypothetical protein
VIKEGGIHTAPDKVEAIKLWEPPTSMTELRSFLGLANYYRRFIKNFAKVARPLTELTKKDAEFKMEGEALEAFRTLKEKLAEAPVLKIPDPSKPFRVTTDASDFAVGAVLEQEGATGWHPVAYHSKALNDAQKKWPAYDKELLAIMEATEKWRPYLADAHFDVFTDHMPLKYLHTKDKLPHRHANYLDWLSRFDFEVHYKPGRANTAADALSRNPVLKQLHVMITVEADPELVERIKKGYDSDPFFSGVKKTLLGEGAAMPHRSHILRQFRLASDGLLYQQEAISASEIRLLPSKETTGGQK